MITRRAPSGRAAAAFLALCALAGALSTCAAGCTPPRRGWGRVDTLAQFTAASLTAIDYVQTTDYVGPRCLEGNPVLGPCARNMPPVLYLGSALLLEGVAAWLLPPRWRAVLEGTYIGVEASSVYTNWDSERAYDAARAGGR